MVLFPSMWASPDIREATGRLSQVKAELEAAGISTSFADLTGESVPDDQNAAVVYTRIARDQFAAINRATQSNRSARNLLQGDLSPGNQSRVRELISAFSGVLDEVVAASYRPKCVFERDWELGLALTFPEYGPLTQVSRILCCRGLLQALRGDLESMSRDLAAAWRIGAHLGSEPSSISSTIRSRIQQFVLRAVMSLATQDGSGPATLGALSKLLDGLKPEFDYGRSLAGEAAHFSATVNDPGFGQRDEMRFGQRLKRDASHRRAYECRALEFVLDLKRAWTQGAGNPVEMYRRTVELLDVLDAKVGASYDYAQQVDARVASHPMSGVELLVRFRMARQAILLGQYRVQAHSWPSSLSDAGAPQLDPFDERPLRYERTNVGFRLRSRCVNLPIPRGIDGDPMIPRNPRNFEFSVPAANIDEGL